MGFGQAFVFVSWVEVVNVLCKTLVFGLYLIATHHGNREFCVMIHHECFKRNQILVGFLHRAIQHFLTVFNAWEKLQGSLGMLRFYRAISLVLS